MTAESYTLIVVDENSERADNVACVMRDNGQLHRVQWANSALTLHRLLEQHPANLVLASATLSWLPLEQVCTLSKQFNALVIALGNPQDNAELLRVLEQGVFCLSTVQHSKLLNQHIKQAIQQSQQLATLRRQQTQIEGYQNRCQTLLDTAKEPVAYTHEGVITSANPAFAKLIGSNDSISLVGRLISDFIAPESLYLFSRNLRQLMRGEKDHVHIDNAKMFSLTAEEVETQLILHNVEIDDELCTQILLRDANRHSSSASTGPQQTETQQTNATAKPSATANFTDDYFAPINLVNDRAPEAFQLHPPLETQALTHKLGKLNAWNGPQQHIIAHPVDSANDPINIKSLSASIQRGRASLVTQAVANLHSDSHLGLARLQCQQQLVPVAQVFEELTEAAERRWLFELLTQQADQYQRLIAPISHASISVDSIETLQQLKPSSALVLAISERSLTNDYHSCGQFLLQLQKLGLQAALWIQSPAHIARETLQALAESVRQGLYAIIINKAEFEQTELGQLQQSEWAQLMQCCQEYQIHCIAPNISQTEQLQAWWQLGASHCIGSEAALSSTNSVANTVHSKR